MEARCGRLRLVVTALRILAWLVLAIGMLVGLFALAGVAASAVFGVPALLVPARVTLLGGLLSLIAALLCVAVLVGAAELIRLLLAIETHTRRLAQRPEAPADEP